MNYFYEGKPIEWEDKGICPLCGKDGLKIHKIKGCAQKLCLICECGFTSRGVTLEDGKRASI